jgi:hypothetical protein
MTCGSFTGGSNSGGYCQARSHQLTVCALGVQRAGSTVTLEYIHIDNTRRESSHNEMWSVPTIQRAIGK